MQRHAQHKPGSNLANASFFNIRPEAASAVTIAAQKKEKNTLSGTLQ